MEWTDRIGRRVKLRDFHILLAVAQWGGISKAAEHLAAVLERYGYSVWFDYQLVKGRDFGLQIDTRIREAKALIVLWCSLSVGSRWVAEEVDLAHHLGIPAVALDAGDEDVGGDGDQRRFERRPLGGHRARDLPVVLDPAVDLVRVHPGAARHDTCRSSPSPQLQSTST